MTATVISSGGVPDSTYGPARRQPNSAAAPETAAEPDPAPTPPGPDDLMLVIQDDAEAGGFVYLTVDRRSGAVIRRLDRAQLMQLRDAAGYAAGAVLRTRA